MIDFDFGSHYYIEYSSLLIMVMGQGLKKIKIKETKRPNIMMGCEFEHWTRFKYEAIKLELYT